RDRFGPDAAVSRPPGVVVGEVIRVAPVIVDEAVGFSARVGRAPQNGKGHVVDAVDPDTADDVRAAATAAGGGLVDVNMAIVWIDDDRTGRPRRVGAVAPGLIHRRASLPAGGDVGEDHFVHVALLDVGQQVGKPASIELVAVDPRIGAARRGAEVAGHGLVNVVIMVHGDAKLMEVVLTLGAAGGLAHRLHRRDEQPNQNADDRN